MYVSSQQSVFSPAETVISNTVSLPSKVTLSIVTTLYSSEKYIDEFYVRASKAANTITNNYEIIFVDDGSPDKSLQIAKGLFEKDNRVSVIQLSRNFGHHRAILAGLARTHGEYVFLVDCDLEEPPELLLEFWKEMAKDKEIDIVFGIQEKRKGDWFESIVGGWFWKIFSYLTDNKILENQIIARLMNRSYVDNLVLFDEADPMLSGISCLNGFNRKTVLVNKGHKRETTYDLRKKISVTVKAIASFSAKPLIMIFYLGSIIMIASMLYVSKLIYDKLVFGCSIEGWVSIAASIWFLGGLILFCLGVIGIYLAMIFNQVKNRPLTIVRQEFRHSEFKINETS